MANLVSGVGILTLGMVAIGCTLRGPAAPVILCLGDSITYGTTKPRHRDPFGGYPGRLQRRLGDRAVVLNRGLGGTTTTFWLANPGSTKGRELWTGMRRMLADLPIAAPSQASSLALAIAQIDRPDIVVLLLGANDLSSARNDPAIVDVVGNRLDKLRQQIMAVAPKVLVGTVLPNTRGHTGLRERLNAQIRTAHPDFLPLGERFTAAGWKNLLGDSIHPTEEGYEVLSEIVAEELLARGLVEMGSRAARPDETMVSSP